MRLRVPDGMGIVDGSRIAGSPVRGTVTGQLLPRRTEASRRSVDALSDEMLASLSA